MAMPLLRFTKNDGSNYPDWENIELSKVFSEITEKNRIDLPVLSVKQGFGTVLRDESGINMVYSKANLKNYKAMKKDDFIIHLRSFEGGLECSNHDGISSPAYKILRCNNLILPSLYKHYFRSKKFISNKLSKTIIGIRDGKNIDMDIFWEITIPVPCPEEQQKIADFFSDIDTQIGHYQQSLDNLEAQKKTLLHQVFTQEIRFTKDDGGDYPDWEETNLKSIGDFKSGSAFPVRFQGHKDLSIPFYKVSDMNNVNNKKYMVNSNNYVSDTMLKEMKGKCIREKSIIFAKVGAAVLLDRKRISNAPFMIDNNMMAFILQDNINFEYLYYWFTNIKLASFVKDGPLPNYNASDLEGITFNYPKCSEEQQKIADFFSDFDERIELEWQRLQTMQELKKGLLQQIFC